MGASVYIAIRVGENREETYAVASPSEIVNVDSHHSGAILLWLLYHLLLLLLLLLVGTRHGVSRAAGICVSKVACKRARVPDSNR